MKTQSICFALGFVLLCPCVSAQWVQLGMTDKSIKDIDIGNNSIYAVTNDSGRIYRSTDGGVTWVQNVQSNVKGIAVAPNGIVFLVKDVDVWPHDHSLYRSTDGGTTWSSRSMTEYFPDYGWDLYGFEMNVAVGPTGTVFCGAECGNQISTYTSFVTTTDDGFSWTSPWTSSWWADDSLGGGSFAFSGHQVITLGYSHGITGGENPGALHLSSDYGLTWRFKGKAPHYARPVALNRNGYVLCGTPGLPHYEGKLFTGGLYLSTDSVASWIFDANDSTLESSWTRISTAVPEAVLSMPEGGTLVGAESSGVFFVNDNGDSTRSLNEGLADLHVHTFALDSRGYLYAGTDKGVWRRPLSEMITSVDPGVTELSNEFVLQQNYPNPFNPSTTIKYELPKSSEVKLSVYDMLGREVSVLVNERRDAGVHEVRFDGFGLSSGVYFYRLQAGEFVQTKTLVLLK